MSLKKYFSLVPWLRFLLLDFVIMLGFTYLTALLLEMIKPGLISNFFDLNIMLIVFILALLFLLIQDTGLYKMPRFMQLYYFIWSLLLLAIFAKFVWLIKMGIFVYLIVISCVLMLIVLARWYYKK